MREKEEAQMLSDKDIEKIADKVCGKLFKTITGMPPLDEIRIYLGRILGKLNA